MLCMFPCLCRIAGSVAAAVALAACGGESPSSIVRVDGKLAGPVVSEFIAANPAVRVRMTTFGTGVGFRNLCMAEFDVGSAGRPIARAEIEECHQAGVAFIELPIAYDGIAIVVHPKATWIDDITISELKSIWSPEAEGKVLRWSQIRAGWPDRSLNLFGANPLSGSRDYFVAAVVGGDTLRSDYTNDADDSVLADAIAQDELALGFVSFKYLKTHSERLKVLRVDNGDGRGPILPTRESIRTGTYQPLARPMFMYVWAQALNRPAVQDFVDFYLDRGVELLEQTGYVPLDDEAYALVAARRRARWTGSMFGEGGPQVGLTMPQLLNKVRVN